jgi:succinate-acetate transporter protein
MEDSPMSPELNIALIDLILWIIFTIKVYLVTMVIATILSIILGLLK